MLYRTPPKCPYCGEAIKGTYKDFSDLPVMMRPIGDSFICWDWRGHNDGCKYHPLNKSKNQSQEDCDYMKQTVIEMTVDSTKQTPSYNVEKPINHTIECNVPYGQDNVYYRMSGGTTLTLMTINDDAAKIFKAGKKVRVTIEPIED
jgi:hypothetical protein